MTWHLRRKPSGIKKIATIKPIKPIPAIKPVASIRTIKPIAPIGFTYFWREKK